MRKLLFAVITLFAGVSLFAQDYSGDFAPLANVRRVRMTLDFSEANIMGYDVYEFGNYEKDWEKDLPTITNVFFDQFNDEMEGSMFAGRYTPEQAPYHILVMVRNISSKGAFTYDAYILDGKGNEVAAVQNIQEKGGLAGTKLARIKIGSYRAGEHLGEIIYREIQLSSGVKYDD